MLLLVMMLYKIIGDLIIKIFDEDLESIC